MNKKLLKKLIRCEFDRLDTLAFNGFSQAQDLINLAEDLGFKSLANEMIDDLNYGN